jgi:hypothetical protein
MVRHCRLAAFCAADEVGKTYTYEVIWIQG